VFSSYDKSLTALSTMLARHGFQTRVIGPGVSVDKRQVGLALFMLICSQNAD
jgi:hypothetical protein